MLSRTPDQLFDALYERSEWQGECLIWLGSTAGRGYGVTCFKSQQVYIHRIIYSFEHPEETLEVVRHTCDNPRCWHIGHLVNGSTQDNVDDKVTKGRHIFGVDNYNTKFTEDNIREIRASKLMGTTLAKKYGVDPATIHYIRIGHTWKHVQ